MCEAVQCIPATLREGRVNALQVRGDVGETEKVSEEKVMRCRVVRDGRERESKPFKGVTLSDRRRTLIRRKQLDPNGFMTLCASTRVNTADCFLTKRGKTWGRLKVTVGGAAKNKLGEQARVPARAWSSGSDPAERRREGDAPRTTRDDLWSPKKCQRERDLEPRPPGPNTR